MKAAALHSPISLRFPVKRRLAKFYNINWLRVVILPVIVICITMITGCDRKTAYLNDFQKFVTDTEQNYKNYSEDDWAISDEEFIKYSQTKLAKYRDSMTQDELTKVNELIGKYQALKLKSSLQYIKDAINDGIDQAKGLIDEIISDSTSN